MPWFKFTKDYDHPASASSVVAYKKGMHLQIPQAAAEGAKAAGAGEETDHEPKPGDAKDGTQEVRPKAGETTKVERTKG